MTDKKQEDVIPEEFKKVLRDFVCDLKTTFPEYDALISKWWKSPSSFSNIEDANEREIAIEKAENVSFNFVFNFCKKKLPPRFFDILYQNAEMFEEESAIDTEFLPHIYFKNLWQFDLSEKTRETIWKYLQLLMFSIVGSLDDKNAFGETAKMFEAINENDFKSKLHETLGKMQDLFNDFGDSSSEDGSNLNMGDIPNANDLHERITGMMDGKLGKLAREIAEETASNLNIDMDNVTDMKDVFQNLMKNPTKLMGLVKNVGDKLDSKMKSGEIKESELLAEATEMMHKMKDIPGMDNIQSLLSKMGRGGMGGGKLNTAAMEAALNRKMKEAKTKERIRAKAEANRLAKEQAALSAATLEQIQNNMPVQQPKMTEEEIVKIFSTGEKVDKTPRNANSQQQPSSGKNKKKKGKK